MENFNSYDDELLPDNFEKMAKAYSQSLKDKGFVFVRLKEEEFNFLVDETLVIIAKMKACLKSLSKQVDSKILFDRLCEAENSLCMAFSNKKTHKFKCVNENAFLCLVALENLLILKLMLLSVKSEEFELCQNIIIDVATIFSESYSQDEFKLS